MIQIQKIAPNKIHEVSANFFIRTDESVSAKKRSQPFSSHHSIIQMRKTQSGLPFFTALHPSILYTPHPALSTASLLGLFML